MLHAICLSTDQKSSRIGEIPVAGANSTLRPPHPSRLLKSEDTSLLAAAIKMSRMCPINIPLQRNTSSRRSVRTTAYLCATMIPSSDKRGINKAGSPDAITYNLQHGQCESLRCPAPKTGLPGHPGYKSPPGSPAFLPRQGDQITPR